MKVPLRFLASIVAVTAIGMAALACDESQPAASVPGPANPDPFGSMTQSLIVDVQFLADAGTLPLSDATCLCDELEAARVLYGQADMTGAEAQLQAFQAHVNDLDARGVLNENTCIGLMDDAQELIDYLLERQRWTDEGGQSR